MNDDPAAGDESATEPTSADDSESNTSETAGSEMSDDPESNASETADSELDDSMSDQRVESLIEQIAAHDEELAAAAHELGDWIDTLEAELEEKDAEIDTLEAELEEKDAEIDTLSEKLSRTRADFQNYKKRTEKQKENMKARATEDLVVRLADVRENLVRALDQDEGADIRPGVESTLETFDDALDAENVSIIKPEPGDDVDPQRHEVMLQVDSNQPEGTVVEVYQNGYEMGGKVLQAAQVTVSNGEL